MNKIQEAIKNQEEYVENYETESAEEWSEYNWESLQEECFLSGMLKISKIVGTCESCKYFLNKKPGICSKYSINKNKDGYCDEYVKKQNL